MQTSFFLIFKNLVAKVILPVSTASLMYFCRYIVICPYTLLCVNLVSWLVIHLRWSKDAPYRFIFYFAFAGWLLRLILDVTLLIRQSASFLFFMWTSMYGNHAVLIGNLNLVWQKIKQKSNICWKSTSQQQWTLSDNNGITLFSFLKQTFFVRE